MRVLASTTVRLSALLAVGLTGSACGAPPELDKQLETLSSWTATMRLAREEHGSGAITRTFATQLRDGAVSALGETEQTVGQSVHSKTDSAYAAAALDSLRTAIRQLSAETGS